MIGMVNRVELRGRARATAPASDAGVGHRNRHDDAELVGTPGGSSVKPHAAELVIQSRPNEHKDAQHDA